MKLIIMLLLTVMPFLATAQTTTYRDNTGRLIGRSTQLDNRTVMRDRTGRIVGRSLTLNGTTTFKDSRGRVTGRSYRR